MKLTRRQLRSLIESEITKAIEEETLLPRNDYVRYGMLSRHNDPGREMYTSCSECGSDMYEGESGVCEQCSSKMHEGKSGLCEQCGTKSMVYEGDQGLCEQCGYSTMESKTKKEYDSLNEGGCGCGTSDMKKDMSDYSLDTMQVVGNALHTLNSAGYNVDATKRKDYKIGNHKIFKGSYMAKTHLYKVHKYAEKLYHMIPDGHNLEDWMRSKIAQISDDIGEVYHALDHDVYEGDI